ncbi:DUF190 domain-containing protein [Mycobacterium uberis]|uniref:DUF190 domain-containing protein n=1 Tax=Mycobacterium uberis TaxID=2162698 RepID=UPI000E30763D|nr:DUF190 domain-containing protein [Mycobacterium uberis]
MIYTAKAARHDELPIHHALVQRLLQLWLYWCAKVLHVIWGFDGGHQPHEDKLFQLTHKVPSTTIIVNTLESIPHSFDIVDELTTRYGLVTSEMVPATLLLDGTPCGSRRPNEITLRKAPLVATPMLPKTSCREGGEHRRACTAHVERQPSVGYVEFTEKDVTRPTSIDRLAPQPN